MAKEFMVRFKRAGSYRGFRRIVAARSINDIEEPIRNELVGLVSGIEQAEITLSEEPDEEGGYPGQINYGLLGEFTVTPL